jgi:hypothetical protein
MVIELTRQQYGGREHDTTISHASLVQKKARQYSGYYFCGYGTLLKDSLSHLDLNRSLL